MEYGYRMACPCQALLAELVGSGLLGIGCGVLCPGCGAVGCTVALPLVGCAVALPLVGSAACSTLV